MFSSHMVVNVLHPISARARAGKMPTMAHRSLCYVVVAPLNHDYAYGFIGYEVAHQRRKLGGLPTYARLRQLAR